MTTARATAFLVAVLAPALLAPARAEVNVAIANGDKVSGTLNPAGEVETFRVDVPRGAVFKVKVKGRPAARKEPKPAVGLRLFDPGGDQVGADAVKQGRTGATLKGYAAQETGTYRIEVVGDGQVRGDYKLVVKWSSPRRFRFPLDDAPGAESEHGSTADVDLRLRRTPPGPRVGDVGVPCEPDGERRAIRDRDA